jgi:tRNA dimethylallyltransferase
MVQAGLIEEARNLYPHRHLNALQTVGYKELFEHFDGKLSLQKAIELIKQNTRRYAKRQLTWFRNDDGYRVYSPDDKEEIIQYIKESCAI